jgi:deoxyribonuclease-4
VLTLCKADNRLSPVVDFGHLNARDCGGVFVTADDYRRLFDKVATTLSDEKAKYMHCHFSKIEWTDKGEKRHLTFADTVYGPDFEPLAEAIAREGLCPRIICESAGTMAEDAMEIKRAYQKYLK